MADDHSKGAASSMSATSMSLSQIMTGEHVNLLGTVHGGVIMKLVDSIAGVVANRYSEGAAVTAAVDEMVFQNPVRVGDIVHLDAMLNWTGRSSMEVGVRVSADRWDAITPRVRVATAYLVMVAVDENGKPREIPQLQPQNDIERRRQTEAQIRRRHRLARREEITSRRAQEGA